MAITISITVANNADALRFLNAIGYSATLPDGVTPNPISAAQAAKSWIVNDMKAQMKVAEGPIAAQVALSANSTDINSIAIT